MDVVDDGPFHCDGRVMDVIAARKADIVQCIKTQLDKAPNSSGTLKMHWVIRPDGSVGDVKPVRPAKNESAFAQCMTALVRKMKFPSFSGPEMPIDFPFKY